MPVLMSGANIANLDLVQVSIATEVSITATSSATGNTCLTSGAFTVENGGNYYVVVYTPYLTLGTTNLDVELWDGSTFLTSLSGHMAAAVTRPGCTLWTRQALIAGGHTIAVKAFVDAGTGKFGANNGATGNAPNAFMRIFPA